MQRAARRPILGLRVLLMSCPLFLVAAMMTAIAVGKHHRHTLTEEAAVGELASLHSARRAVNRMSRPEEVAALQGLYCFDCHNLLSVGEAADLIRFSHLTHLDRGYHCGHCHRDAGQEDHGAVPMETCLECHDGDTAPERCTLCHTDPSHALPNTHGAGWLTRHGEAGRQEKDCVTCHRRESCETCHTSRRPANHTDNWVHTHARFARQQQDR